MHNVQLKSEIFSRENKQLTNHNCANTTKHLKLKKNENSNPKIKRHTDMDNNIGTRHGRQSLSWSKSPIPGHTFPSTRITCVCVCVSIYKNLFDVEGIVWINIQKRIDMIQIIIQMRFPNLLIERKGKLPRIFQGKIYIFHYRRHRHIHL